MGSGTASGRIKVEEFVDGDHLVVRAELPGVDPDKDIAVTTEDDVLTIRAERSSETSKKTDGGYHSEFSYGSFARQLRMPPGTQADQIVASYKDGVLEIRLPQPVAADRTKSIPVSRG
jgi:HSP20 family protein